MKSAIKLAAAGLLLSAANTQAANITVEIINLTQGITFTPFLVAAHAGNTHLFEVGEAASAGLQAMAEGGDISTLVTTVQSISGVTSENPAGGLLAPGTSATTPIIDTGSNDLLSITAMLLPTNDAFAGLDAWQIPSAPGAYTVYLNAYDAGTEVNDELLVGAPGGAPGVVGMPGDPGGQTGTSGTGVADLSTNSDVHIHRGVLGDTDSAGGSSDLDSRIHRWLNPVVKVVVTVQ